MKRKRLANWRVDPSDTAGYVAWADEALVRYDYDAETSFVYDGRLNLTKRIEGTGAGALESTFEYDAYDRLTTATLPTGRVKAFTYGPLSRRLATKDVDGSAETHFYGAGWETYADLDEDLSPTRVYVSAGGMDRQAAMLAKDGAEWKTYYYLRDHLGSVIALVDEDGDVVESYEYEPYGMPTVSTVAGDAVTTGRASSVGNRFLFAGREWDADLELYHFRYRTYLSEFAYRVGLVFG